MLRAAIVAAVTVVALPAAGDQKWMTADEFESLVSGNATQLFDEYGDLFGTEYFLPDRGVIWQFAGAADCTTGTWRPKAEAICYAYADGDTSCLRYYAEGKKLTGVEWDDGQPSGDTYVLVITTAQPPQCGTT